LHDPAIDDIVSTTVCECAKGCEVNWIVGVCNVYPAGRSGNQGSDMIMAENRTHTTYAY